MYKDILNTLKKDRKVNESFLNRLERNGFEICYGKYDFWDNQEYVVVGKQKIWLVCRYYSNNGVSVVFRYRNEVVEEIKEALEEEKAKLEQEQKLVEKVLPKK